MQLFRYRTEVYDSPSGAAQIRVYHNSTAKAVVNGRVIAECDAIDDREAVQRFVAEARDNSEGQARSDFAALCDAAADRQLH